MVKDSDKVIGPLVRHALIGEGFTARMFSENPKISKETRKAYEWAEGQFIRIANGKVDEKDWIG